MVTTGLAAILFCDGVQSTELLVQLGDRRFTARRRQFEALVRGAINRHKGRLVKTLGDGAMATFETASDALASGVSIQQAVRRAGTTDRGVLAARVGISAGEVTFEDGDVFGTTVVEASRIC